MRTYLFFKFELMGDSKKWKFIIQTLSLVAVMVGSFFYFSSYYHVQFDSDDGVVVLMLHSFEWPENFYFWNQTRVGSITPLLGQVFYKGLDLSPILSESIAHYIVLAIGFLGFSKLFKSFFSKFIFSLVWFFPLLHFTGVVRYTFGLQYAFIGMAIGLIIVYQEKAKSTAVSYVYLLLIALALFCSLWASDSAVLSIPVLLLLLFFHAKRSSKSTFWNMLKTKESLFAIACGVLGLGTILFMKMSVETHLDIYTDQLFNGFSEIGLSIAKLVEHLGTFFLFQTDELPESIYAWLIVILLVVLFLFRKQASERVPNIWIRFFLFDATLLFVSLLLFHWALQNGMPRRYFCGVYISLWIAVLLYIEMKGIRNKSIQGIICVCALLGLISTPYGYTYNFPKSTQSKREMLSEFSQLGNIGVIGDYWSSYVLSATNPDLIVATPYEASWAVRRYDIAEQVFHQDRIFVIRDNWMSEFPDTLREFNHVLIKKGDDFYMGNCDVSEYEELK